MSTNNLRRLNTDMRKRLLYSSENSPYKRHRSEDDEFMACVAVEEARKKRSRVDSSGYSETSKKSRFEETSKKRTSSSSPIEPPKRQRRAYDEEHMMRSLVYMVKSILLKYKGRLREAPVQREMLCPESQEPRKIVLEKSDVQIEAACMLHEAGYLDKVDTWDEFVDKHKVICESVHAFMEDARERETARLFRYLFAVFSHLGWTPSMLITEGTTPSGPMEIMLSDQIRLLTECLGVTDVSTIIDTAYGYLLEREMSELSV